MGKGEKKNYKHLLYGSYATCSICIEGGAKCGGDGEKEKGERGTLKRNGVHSTVPKNALLSGGSFRREEGGKASAGIKKKNISLRGRDGEGEKKTRKRSPSRPIGRN